VGGWGGNHELESLCHPEAEGPAPDAFGFLNGDTVGIKMNKKITVADPVIFSDFTERVFAQQH
jgi:hypothetical protein